MVSRRQRLIGWILYVVALGLIFFSCSDSVDDPGDASVADDADQRDRDSDVRREDADRGDADEAISDASDSDIETESDADMEGDAECDVDIPPLDITCEEDGTATTCTAEEECISLGPCPLGCDEAAGACYVPSNVPADIVGEAAGDLDISWAGSSVLINADTGQIAGSLGQLRPPMEGIDPETDTGFSAIAQPDGPELAVLTLGSFTVPAGVEVYVVGARPLAIVAAGEVAIFGTIDVGAVGEVGGPGGFDGGAPGAAGHGDCGGQMGLLESSCAPFCASGGGGGGHGGAGGRGGAMEWVLGEEAGVVDGGLGGSRCGSALLVPLVGGSGGAGGTLSEEDRPEVPGPGGGGGGAIQVTSTTSISLGPGGVIAAPGDGGAETLRGGGAGGGSGGAVLLEAPIVVVNTAAFVTANGGGGGGGDCT